MKYVDYILRASLSQNANFFHFALPAFTKYIKIGCTSKQLFSTKISKHAVRITPKVELQLPGKFFTTNNLMRKFNLCFVSSSIYNLITRDHHTSRNMYLLVHPSEVALLISNTQNFKFQQNELFRKIGWEFEFEFCFTLLIEASNLMIKRASRIWVMFTKQY